MPQLEDALAHVDRAEIVALTRKLIDIPSPVGEEAALAKYIAERLSAVGLSTRLQEVEPGRLNVTAVLEGSGGGAGLLFGSHLDTTYRGDEEGIRDFGDAYQPRSRLVDDWIFGLGVSNMKGGIAATLTALEAIARAKIKLRGDLVFSGVVGETCHVPVAGYQGSRYRGCGIGARHLVAAGIPADYAVFSIPTSGAISLASGGFVYFELITRGDPGSSYRRSGYPQTGPSNDAVSKMLKAIPHLLSWGEDFSARSRYQGQPSGYARIIAMEGGHPFHPTKLASICRLYFEVGMMPGEDQEAVISQFRRAVEALRDVDAGLELEVKVVEVATGAQTSPDEPLVEAVATAHQATWGEPPNYSWDGWATDSALFIRAGTPSLSYGAQGRTMGGSAGYPREGEHVNIDDLVRGAEVYVRTALDVCMRDRPAAARQRES